MRIWDRFCSSVAKENLLACWFCFDRKEVLAGRLFEVVLIKQSHKQKPAEKRCYTNWASQKLSGSSIGVVELTVQQYVDTNEGKPEDGVMVGDSHI